MRQLRFNYTFPTGYVQPYPQISNSYLIWPMLYGGCPTTTLDQSTINTLTLSQITSIPSSVTLPAIENEFIQVLVPATIDTVASFTVNGVTTPFTLVTTTAQDGQIDPYYMIVNGVDYAFNYYRSNTTFSGSGIVLGITPTALAPFVPTPPLVTDEPE